MDFDTVPASNYPLPDLVDFLNQGFEGYFIPKKNVSYERRLFTTNVQLQGQTVDMYVTVLRRLARSCEYGTLTESLIKDQLIAGVNDDQLRERLLRATDLNLQKALDICRASECTKVQMEGFRPTDVPIQVMSKFTKKKGFWTQPIYTCGEGKYTGKRGTHSEDRCRKRQV